MLKELVKKFRSRSQSEPTPQPPATKAETSKKENKPKSRDDARVPAMSNDRFNSARVAKILASCEKENQPEARFPEEECCVCLIARATILASPCNHRVICKKCAVLLITKAHDEHCLTLKCVLCRQIIKKFDMERREKKSRYCEDIVPYDLNIPRALGRRSHSMSGSRGQQAPTTSAAV